MATATALTGQNTYIKIWRATMPAATSHVLTATKSTGLRWVPGMLFGIAVVCVVNTSTIHYYIQEAVGVPSDTSGDICTDIDIPTH